MGLHALHVQPDVHMCDWVSPPQSAKVANVGVSKEREKRRERKTRLLLITKKRGKEGKNPGVLDFCLRLESSHSYAGVATDT